MSFIWCTAQGGSLWLGRAHVLVCHFSHCTSISCFCYLIKLSCDVCSDCCKTSIFDLHRSCPCCNYDLCLQCCWELRDGNPQGNKEEVLYKFIDPGAKYLHGGPYKPVYKPDMESTAPKEKIIHNWKSLDDGRIPCPPESMGGCGRGILELMYVKRIDSVSTLLESAKELLKKHQLEEDMREMPEEWCTCSDTVNGSDDDKQLRKSASRENSNDNYLYCPRAIDIQSGDLKHFQWHWSKGQPVIVSNVLETTLGLSWEPMVMWRAFRQISHTKHDQLLDVSALNCLDWCEVRSFILLSALVNTTMGYTTCLINLLTSCRLMLMFIIFLSVIPMVDMMATGGLRSLS